MRFHFLAHGNWPATLCDICENTPSVVKTWEDGKTFYFCRSCRDNFVKPEPESKEEITKPIEVKAG